MIPLLFTLSTVRGVARVIAKVIVGGRYHVDYDGLTLTTAAAISAPGGT